MAITKKPEVIVRLYEQAKSLRSQHENDWRLASAHCWPAQYSSWNTVGPAAYSPTSEAARRVAFDSTGARSLPKYTAILERLATPSSMKWHGLEPGNDYLKKSNAVRTYFEALTSLLFKLRYHPQANFKTMTGEMYGSMGVYGNGPIFVGKSRKTPVRPVPGVKYVPCAMRDVFWLVDDEGNITHVFRRFWLNVRQFRERFGNDVPMPYGMQSEANKPQPDETRFFEFVHYACPCDEGDHDPTALSVKRHPIRTMYVYIEGKEFVGDEEGYASMPYLIPRTETITGDPYGFSPAIRALPSMGTASQIKKTTLKQAQKAVDPVLLAYDDGVMNGTVDQRPGAVNYGGVDSQGRLLIQRLPMGDFRVSEVMMQEERKDIEDSFFVTLFQILTETPEMTATEVVERVAEKASLLSPTMGRLHSGFLGPCIQREIEIATELGLLPEMPPELVEAKGEYEVVYTSPMARGMYAEEVSGFMRAFEFAMNAAQVTQDPSLLDAFDLKTAIPEITYTMGGPSRWMLDAKQQQAKAEERNSQMQDAELLKNAPALASAAKTVSDMQGGNQSGR